MTNGKHRARKRFGQHFVTDTCVLDRIVSAFAPRPGQNLIEIGPGLGALTTVLLQRVPHLTAIELDRDLVARLRQNFGEHRLTINQMDILDCDLGLLEKNDRQKKLRLIGNLPYNISTPLLFHLLEQIDLIEDMLFMLQKELALRLAATPGNSNYGRLSVMTSLELDCECLFDVPPDAFDPRPKVDSTIISLKPKSNKQYQVNRKALNKIVTAAFAQRRKTLRNALSGLVSIKQFELAEIMPASRAETLSTDDFIRLTKFATTIDKTGRHLS